MNIRNRRLSVTLGALLSFLAVVGVVEAAKIPFTHASSGKIAFIDSGHLVVTHQKSGKPETLNFVLSRDTSRNGPLDVGNVVTVHYRMEKDQRVATSIQAQRPKEAPQRTSR